MAEEKTEENGWETVAQIADRLRPRAPDGLSAERVAQVVAMLGLRESERHSRGDGQGREYSPSAASLVERELRSRGTLSRVCGCGAVPDGTESDGVGDYVDERGRRAWLCLACWCAATYGAGAIETLEARRQARKADRR